MAQAWHFTQMELEEALEKPGVVAVDFWATWCMPCKMMAPVIEQLAEAYDGRAAVGKVDIDEEPGLAAKYGIRSIPTIILFKDGQPAETLVGVRPAEALAQAIDRLLG